MARKLMGGGKNPSQINEQSVSKKRIGLETVAWMGPIFVLVAWSSNSFSAASSADGINHACLRNISASSTVIHFDETSRTDSTDPGVVTTACMGDGLNSHNHGFVRSINQMSDGGYAGGTDGANNMSFDNTAFANADGTYIAKDSQGYCWEFDYVSATTSFTAVREATAIGWPAYVGACANINIPNNSVRASLNTTYLTMSLLGLTAIFIRRKYKIKLVKN
ncbi:hypothetical protein QUF74_11085 [Candidatus Halobeggiatoa sp. HSG11]|nr:hypothetical protein [Candidatus Halobeggiatoa sp. HSG11]